MKSDGRVDVNLSIRAGSFTIFSCNSSEKNALREAVFSHLII